jgi:hypothetical protein
MDDTDFTITREEWQQIIGNSFIRSLFKLSGNETVDEFKKMVVLSNKWVDETPGFDIVMYTLITEKSITESAIVLVRSDGVLKYADLKE